MKGLIVHFGLTKDYSEMLRKIATFTFIVSCILMVVVTTASPSLSTFVDKFSLSVDLFGIKKIAIGYIIPPALITIIARVIKLHDKISDVFKIREVFDICEILIPLAGGVGIATNLQTIEKFRNNRDDLMREAYFEYAGSMDPKIDPHLISTALDKWSWFWILIESVIVGILAQVVLLVIGAYQHAAWLGSILLVAIVIASTVHKACASAAHTQVKAILTDSQRQIDIRKVLNDAL